MNAQTSPAFGGAISPDRQSASQEGRGPQGASDDELNVAIMAMHARSLEQPVENKGCLGDPASLTGWVTVKKGADVMMVPCLYDGGSESTYFHPEMEPMGISRRKKTFHLETLSMQGQVEEVDGLIVTFEAIMADGQVRKIEALKHHGIGLCHSLGPGAAGRDPGRPHQPGQRHVHKTASPPDVGGWGRLDSLIPPAPRQLP